MIVRKAKLQRVNFKGQNIPAGYGFVISTSAIPVYLMMAVASVISRDAWSYIVAILGFGLLGLADDIYGTREAGGFKGHFSLLLKGRVTTGIIKVFAGGILSLLLGLIIAGYHPIAVIVNGLLIALSANTLNLLDLRPGRAVSFFWLGLIILILAFPKSIFQVMLLPVIIPCLYLTILDRSAKVMLGDAGSNVLGAVLGVSFAMAAGSPCKITIIILLICIHVYAEKYSISRLIESNRILRRIDGLLGER
jgi:UDP-N-acetylmuramyl pentapeptide phosphotransferase/UDP-N-acetylglucosamine-1-phosphate transferase